MAKKKFVIEENKEKSNIELLNDLFNHIRNQLDFLCESAKYQNAILKELYEKEVLKNG